jgi:O-antigen/teichoic acid export membrane protein
MQLLQPAVYVVLIVLAWAFDIAVVATILGASLIGTAATFGAGRILVRVPMRGERADSKALLRRGVTFFGSALAEAAPSRADQVLALPLIGAYQAGLYSVAATIGAVPLAIGQALGASYFAPMAQAQGQARRQLQSEAIRAALVAALVATPLVALAAWPSIPLVFGDAFAASIPATMASLVGSAALLTAYVASMALAADRRGIRMTIAQVISLLFGLLGLFTLGPAFGALGAAIASSFGYFTLLTVLLISLRLPMRKLVPQPSDFISVMKRLRRD